MSTNGQLRDEDIVTAINNFANQAFELKRDLENTTMQLAIMKPDLDFEPCPRWLQFLQSEQDTTNLIRAKVIHSLVANVVDAAEDESCPPNEKAEEADSYLKTLTKSDFRVDTDGQYAAFSAALNKTSESLDHHIEQAKTKANTSTASLTESLEALKKKKTELQSKESSLGDILDVKLLSGAVSAYSKHAASGKTPAAGNAPMVDKAPATNPLSAVGSAAKGLVEKQPDAEDNKEIDALSKHIEELQVKINVIEAENAKALKDAEEMTRLKDSLGEYDGRFREAAANLNKVQEVPKAAQIYVQDYLNFLRTPAAKDPSQLREHTQLLKMRTQMFRPIDSALAGFISRRV